MLNTQRAIPSDSTRTPKPRTTMLQYVAVGTILAVLVAVILYWRTLGIGFLLDDFYHVNYLYSAFHGEPSHFLTHLIGDWSSNSGTVLACYRPGTAIWLVFNYLLWGCNAWGYHLANVLLYAATTVIVGLLALQIGGYLDMQRKALACTCAAMLFAVYPLHVESVSWVIGSVDILCTFFYLISLLLFLRFVELKRPVFLLMSLGAFLAALCCKEMAVTLPAVLSLSALLLPINDRKMITSAEVTPAEASYPRGQDALAAINRRLKGKSLGWFWLMLAVFALWRTAAIGTVIGGYGGFNARIFKQSALNFTDMSTWLKVICGASEEFTVPHIVPIIAWAGFLVCAAMALYCLARRTDLLSLYLFLLLWLAIGIMPTYQIWHIFPNLVGSRLFFLSSTPLCLFLAFALAEFANGKARILRPSTSVVTLIALAGTWAFMTDTNLQAWTEAGKRMSNTMKQLNLLWKQAKAEDKFLFTNLPADYKGAGLIGCPKYLSLLCKPPWLNNDYSQRLLSYERLISGAHDYVWPQAFQRATKLASRSFLWDDIAGKFAKYQGSTGKANIEIALANPKNASHNDPLWLTSEPLNPLAAQAIVVSFARPAKNIGPLSLIWRAPNQIWWQCKANPALVQGNKVVFLPDRMRSWTFASTISSLGLQPCHVPPTHVSVIDSREFEPRVEATENRVSFDVSKIDGACSAKLFVAHRGQFLSDLAVCQPPPAKLVSWVSRCSKTAGTITVPAALLCPSDVQEACIVALDKDGNPTGVLSEPIIVTKKQ